MKKNVDKKTTGESTNAPKSAVPERLRYCKNCNTPFESGAFQCNNCNSIDIQPAFKHFFSQKKVRNAVAGVLIATVVIAVGGYLYNRPENPGIESSIPAAAELVPISVQFGKENYTMPDVVGLDVQDAAAKLSCMGVNIEQVEVEAQGYAGGCVVQQLPGRYEAVNRGDTVQLAVAKEIATPAGKAPDMTGKTYDQAMKAAAKQNVAVKVTEKVFDSSQSYEDDSGVVVSQRTPAGSQLAENQPLEITVAIQPQEFKEIEVTGMEAETAIQLLENMGVVVETMAQEDLESTNGIVLMQEVPEVIQPGDPARLVVCRNEHMRVPNAVGMPQDEAIALMEENGMRITLDYDHTPGQQKGQVVLQSIPGGAVIALDEESMQIVLCISDPDILAVVPDVRGQKSEAAQKLLQEMGFRVSVASRTSSSVAAGKVIQQEPAAGSSQSHGSEVQIVVSIGGAGGTAPTAGAGNHSGTAGTVSASNPAQADNADASGSSGAVGVGNTDSASSTVSSPAAGSTPEPVEVYEPLPAKILKDPYYKEAINVLKANGATQKEIDSGKYNAWIELYVETQKSMSPRR